MKEMFWQTEKTSSRKSAEVEKTLRTLHGKTHGSREWLGRKKKEPLHGKVLYLETLSNLDSHLRSCSSRGNSFHLYHSSAKKPYSYSSSTVTSFGNELPQSGSIFQISSSMKPRFSNLNLSNWKDSPYKTQILKKPVAISNFTTKQPDIP